ncbi:MAG: hypothetical protein SGPRY_006833 [Prymnesium sp.]
MLTRRVSSPRLRWLLLCALGVSLAQHACNTTTCHLNADQQKCNHTTNCNPSHPLRELSPSSGRQLLILSHGSTASASICRALCSLRVPCAHSRLHCHTPFPTPHRSLLLAHEQAVQCLALNLTHAWCDARRWASRVRRDLFNLPASNSGVALSGEPYASLLGGLPSFIECGAKLVLSLRKPTEWAASRQLSHGHTPICAHPVRGKDPFDLYSCAARCTGALTACFSRVDSMSQSSLAAAYNISQSRMLAKYGRSALVLRLFSGNRCDEECLKSRLQQFLELPGGVRKCGTAHSSAQLQPAAAESATSTRRVPNLPKLYIWKLVDSHTSTVLRFWDDIQRNLSWDAAVPVQIAEHLSDLPLLQALESHPARTHKPDEARFHVLAPPAFASLAIAIWASSLNLKNHEGRALKREHYNQMVRIALQLQANEYFQADAPFLVIMGYFFPHIVFGSFLHSTLVRGNVILATTDPGYGEGSPLFERSVVIPYRSSEAAEAISRSSHHAAEEFDFMLHGDFSRRDGGIRQHMAQVMRELRDQRVRVSLEDRSGFDRRRPKSHRWPPTRSDADDELSSVIHQSVHTMRKARYCLVPSGDTLTSRRLFEVLAAGCMPIILRGSPFLASAYLPFQARVNWTNISHFLSLSSASSVPSTAARLVQLLKRPHHSRLEVRSAFKSFFSVAHRPRQVVDALLHELDRKKMFRSVWSHDKAARMRELQPFELRPAAFCLLPRHRLLVCTDDVRIRLVLAAISGSGSECITPAVLQLSSKALQEVIANPFWQKAAFVEESIATRVAGNRFERHAHEPHASCKASYERPNPSALADIRSHASCGGLPHEWFQVFCHNELAQLKPTLVATGMDPLVAEDALLSADLNLLRLLNSSSLSAAGQLVLSRHANYPEKHHILPFARPPRLVPEWSSRALARLHHSFTPLEATSFDFFNNAIRTEVEILKLPSWDQLRQHMERSERLAIAEIRSLSLDPPASLEQSLPNSSTEASGDAYYAPAIGLAVCICRHCGSSSLFKSIYRQLFKTEWPNQTPSSVESLGSQLWRQVWQPLRKLTNQSLLRHRIAFVEEPRSRLLSAFDDKFRCGGAHGDAFTAHYTQRLLALEGRGRAANSCLTLEVFGQVLANIQKDGRASQVNSHIRSQAHACFDSWPIGWWDRVALPSDASAAMLVAQAVGSSQPESIAPTAPPPPLLLPAEWSLELEKWVSSDVRLLAPFMKPSARQQAAPGAQLAPPLVLAIIPRCSGSTHLHALAHRVLSTHGVNLCGFVSANVLRTGSTPSQVADELRVLPSSLREEQREIAWVFGQQLGVPVLPGGDALRLLRQQSMAAGCTSVVIQHTHHEDRHVLRALLPTLRELDTPVVIVYRNNLLDRLICEIKDCLIDQYVPKTPGDHNSIGVARDNSGEFSRRCTDENDSSLKIEINTSSAIHVMNTWSEEAATQAHQLHRYGFSEHRTVSYEGLSAFQYSERSSEAHETERNVNTSLVSWTKFLGSWRIQPDKIKIRQSFLPDMGKSPEPLPHSKTIFNAQAVRHFFAKSDQKYAALYRDG